MAEYWSNFCCRQGGCLCFTKSLVLVNPYVQDSEIYPQETTNISLYRTVWCVFWRLESFIGVTHECDRRTDGRTDGQTSDKKCRALSLLRCAAKNGRFKVQADYSLWAWEGYKLSSRLYGHSSPAHPLTSGHALCGRNIADAWPYVAMTMVSESLILHLHYCTSCAGRPSVKTWT